MTKKNFLKTFILICTLGFSFYSAHALNGIVAFGDSLTDNGNTSDRIGKYILPKFIWTIPNTKRYYEGRFSNGPVWVEIVAQTLTLPLEDKAQGSANAYNDALRVPLLYPSGVVLSLVHQVDDYLSEFQEKLDSEKLYVLWVGGNDYALSNEKDPNKVVVAIMDSLSKLHNAGAQKFLVMNLPDLSEAPLVQEGGTDWENPEELKNILIQHNSELAQRVHEFNLSTNLVHIELYDVDTLFKLFNRYPDSYGFSNTKNRCYEGGFIFKYGDPIPLGPAEISLLKSIEKMLMSGSKIKYKDAVCSNPDSYLFWDAMHPTAHTHKVFAAMVTEFIRAKY